jgi:hypothetical protein
VYTALTDKGNIEVIPGNPVYVNIDISTYKCSNMGKKNLEYVVILVLIYVTN